MTVRQFVALCGPFVQRMMFPASVRESKDFRFLARCTLWGFGLLAVLMVSMSVFEHARWSLTQDFAAMYQVWYEVGHGHFNPADTIDRLPRYWQVHFELYVWLLAPFAAIFQSGLFLSLFQDACGLAACGVSWRWMQTMLYDPKGAPVPARLTLAVSSLCVLAFNPWIYWSYAFDFHSEPVAIAFLVASAYAFYSNRLVVGFGLAICVLLEGDVTGTYLVGLGVTMLLAKRDKLLIGISLALIGLVWLQFTHALGAGVMSAFTPSYGYLIYGELVGGGNDDPLRQALGVRELIIGLVAHPERVLVALKDKLLDIYANLAPIGIVGVLSPWALGVCFLVLLENQLTYSYAYSQPSFQSMPLYIFGAIGFTSVLVWASRVGAGKIVKWFAIVVAVDSLVWSAVWVPQLPTHWVRVSAAQAAVLTKIKKQISPKDQVISTQGVVGDFADRASVNDFWARTHIERGADTVQIIISPYAGVNVESVNRALAALDTMVNRYEAVVRLHDQDIWWLTVGGLNDPSRAYDVPTGARSVPGWACPGAAAYSVIDGPPSEWHAFSNRQRGYVVSRAYWRETAGNYRAAVDIASTGPATIEIWNSTADELLWRQLIPPGPRRTVNVDFRHLDRGEPRLFEGVGPFRIDAIEPPIHDAVEIRVFSFGVGTVSVYRLAVQSLAVDAGSTGKHT